MNYSILTSAVRRSNITMIGLSIAALVVAAVLAAYTSVPYFAALLGGPTPMGSSQLSRLTASDANLYFREISGTIFDSGYYEYTESYGRESTDAYFGILLVDDVPVVVRTSEPIVDETKGVYVGAFVQANAEQSQIFRELSEQAPELSSTLVPLIFDTMDKRISWLAGLAGLAAVVIGSLWGIGTVARRVSNPLSHPIFKKLARFGEPETIVKSIESDLVNGCEQIGKMKLGSRWLMMADGGAFAATRYDDILWIYKHITTTKAYGVITTGRAYAAHIHDKHGETITIRGKEKQVDAMLEAAIQRAPWALAGFSADIKKAWDKDRQQLVAAVAQRRQQF